MKESENMKISTVSCFVAILIFGLTGCGNTMKGFETDIIQKRQAMSDFINPSSDSSEPVEEETPSGEKVKEEKKSD